MNEFFSSGWGKALLILAIVFLGVQTAAGLENLRYIGAGITPSNVVSVSGYGEAFGEPDLATFSFSIVSDKLTVANAQADATAKINAVTNYLTDAGIDKKDIQTSDYSVQPQYDYVQQACAGGYCPGGKQVLRGYEVRQSTTVKVRDTTKAGDLLTGVGTKGATEVSGLSFTFDDPYKLQNDSRAKAIADAKKKAQELAKELGVSLVRVVSFSENGNTPGPMYYAKGLSMSAAESSAPAAPDISVGQNKVTSNVSVTYEIR